MLYNVVVEYYRAVKRSQEFQRETLVMDGTF